jgi:two-component system cell cycle response regulator DivK
LKRILLVDDHEDSRIIYRTFLRHAGFAVTECGDGASAIRSASEEQPDLILMDLALPVLDGWEATRILKSDARTRHIRIVALTANARAADRVRAGHLAFDGYLTKPATPRRVLTEVESQIGPDVHEHRYGTNGERSPG